MNLIVVLDDKNGMAFNHRRQSRDRVLTERILQMCGGELTVDSYTASLFEGLAAKLKVSADPFSDAGQGEWCFSELLLPALVTDRIERLVIYRWNRVYPSDLKFELDVSAMKLLSKTDFAGFSHEKLTEEVYAR